MSTSDSIHDRLSDNFSSKIFSNARQLIPKVRFLSSCRIIPSLVPSLLISWWISLLVPLWISLRIIPLRRIALRVTLRIPLRITLRITLRICTLVIPGIVAIRVRLARISRILTRIVASTSLSLTGLWISSIHRVSIDPPNAFFVGRSTAGVTGARRVSSGIRGRIRAARITTRS